MKKLVALFLFIQISCLAQYKQGLHFFHSYQFAKAIPYLQKAANEKNAHQKEAALFLANSYARTEDFKDAEPNYQKAIDLGNTEAEVYYNYGNVLKSNGKYEEALKQYSIYLQKRPNDDKAKNAVKSFQEIKLWQSLPKEYEIKNIEKINTKKSEFSPFVFNDRLYYTSWQKPDLVNYEGFDFDNTPYLNVFYCGWKNDTLSGKNKPFSKIVNSLYHDGPIFFSKQNELYLTRVNYTKHNKKDTSFVNRPQVYVALKNGKKWGKLKPFAYNNPSYSLAHACVSDDGNTLFFSSDMPGGYGGSDIWMCSKNASGTWDKPINLGSDINTSGKEEFPFIRKDGMLFFSSDGLPGFGGLDVFSAKQIAGKWILNRNEGVGINSQADDFGVFFTSENKGYVSSNRDGGKGRDDIYAFTFTKKLIFVDGTVLTSQDASSPAKNLKVILEDTKGNKILDTRTNKDGYFRFENLSPDSKYMVKIDENDGEFSHFKRYYFMDSDGQVMRVTVINEKGEKFVFKNLPVDGSSLPQLDSPDDVTLAGNLLYGENPSKPIANQKIVLKDANGNVVDEATTNAFGAFVFNKIPPDEKYIIELVAEDNDIYAGAKIILTNKNGKEVSVIQSGEKGKFAFNILASDKAAMESLSAVDADLLVDVEGFVLDPEKKAIQKVKVYLTNEKGNVKDSILTDDKGFFFFKKLFGGENYIVSIDENDSKLNGINKIFITDKTGKTIQELVRNHLKGFSFAILKSDKSSLKEVYVDDPWLEVLNMKADSAKTEKKEEITIIENVYYALNAYKFDNAGQHVMDKVVQIMVTNPNITIEISSHTDSQGDDKTNLVLSQKRAKYATDYIISKGIEAKRLKGVGYGETKLINKCGNNVPCNEEEHAQNRRTEFKIDSK